MIHQGHFVQLGDKKVQTAEKIEFIFFSDDNDDKDHRDMIIHYSYWVSTNKKKQHAMGKHSFLPFPMLGLFTKLRQKRISIKQVRPCDPQCGFSMHFSLLFSFFRI